jgi:oligosaccharyltransferase complex subunit beta
VLEFIDSGRNVLLTASSNVADPVREIASECNVEFDAEDSFVIDHFNYDASDSGAHTLIVADNLVQDAPVIVSKENAPVLFRGIGQDIEEDSELLFAVLSGSATAYSTNPTEAVDELHVAGKKTVLFSVLQARNNARVGFSGSLELFSDK